ncbi:hypothetical protein [Paenarthrobacter sp. NPDC018779]|uniref:hypothetical protein n=1 Tax=Paenarthrobacter sp. NPDC018779 TaxID=3364375 RepID=UPI0037C54AA4
MRVTCSMPVGTSYNQYALVAARVALCSAPLEDVTAKISHAGKKESVDNVHTYRAGLARTTTGLARIPHVSAGSQQ